MMDYDWMQDIRQYRPVYVCRDADGQRVVRPIETVQLPDDWEVDKSVRPVVD